MPYIPVEDTVMAELIYNWDGQICETVLNYSQLINWDVTQMTALAASLATKWTAVLKPLMPTNLSLINIKITDISTQFGPVVDYGVGLPNVGTHASPSLPNNCALVITKRTALRGRSFRGRIYHPGLLEAQTTGNAVAAGTVTAYIVAYNNFLLVPNGGGADAFLTVVSRRFEGAPRLTGVATKVSNLTSDGSVDSQRKRLPGRGA